MKKEIQLHPSQAEILRVLLFNPKPRFRDLNCQRLSSDHFSFHIKSLAEAGLIVKREKNYCLTAVGKEFANRLDAEREVPQVEKQAKISVLIFAIQKQGGVQKYLLQQRLKQPYFGYFGGVGGKLKIGETLFEGAEREFAEETGLVAKLSLVGVSHKMDYSQEKVLLEDKIFFVFRANNPKGDLIKEFQGGKNFWFSLPEIKKLPKLFPDVLDKLKMVRTKQISFAEKKYFVDEF
ncbi:MAG: NUDIX domain-containing protein [Candidatus Gribaldobacteria bacterium]|nr:NUDIX domain-containing protein [Candidatus Gribaldobacteria bacterium]